MNKFRAWCAEGNWVYLLQAAGLAAGLVYFNYIRPTPAERNAAAYAAAPAAERAAFDAWYDRQQRERDAISTAAREEYLACMHGPDLMRCSYSRDDDGYGGPDSESEEDAQGWSPR